MENELYRNPAMYEDVMMQNIDPETMVNQAPAETYSVDIQGNPFLPSAQPENYVLQNSGQQAPLVPEGRALQQGYPQAVPQEMVLPQQQQAQQIVDPSQLVIPPQQGQVQAYAPRQNIMPYSPQQVMGELRKGQKIEAQGISKQNALQQKLADNMSRLRQEEIQERDLKKRQYDNSFKSMMDDIDKEYEELGKQKIDSGRVFSNMSTGRKVLFGIGMVLSAFTKEGAQNSLKIIDKAIDRDIADQKYQIANKRTGLTGKINKLSLFRQKYGDDRLAENADRMLKYQKVLDEIQPKMAIEKNKDRLAQQKYVSAELMNKVNSLAKQNHTIIKEQMENAYNYQMGSPFMKKVIQRFPFDKKKQDDAMTEMGEHQKQQFTVRKISDIFDKFKDDGGVVASWIPWTQSSELEKQAKGDILGLVSPIWKGPMSETDAKNFEALIPSFGLKFTDNKLNQMKQKMIDMILINAKPLPTLIEMGIKMPSLKEIAPKAE